MSVIKFKLDRLIYNISLVFLLSIGMTNLRAFASTCGCGSNMNTNTNISVRPPSVPSVHVYRFGNYMYYEQTVEDSVNKSKVTINIWVSVDGKSVGFYIMELKPGSPGTASGHIYSKTSSILKATALVGFIPKCSARQYAEGYLHELNKNCGCNLSDMTSSNYSISFGFMDGSESSSSSSSHQVQRSTTGSSVNFHEEFIDSRGIKNSICLSSTGNKKYIVYSYTVESSEIHGSSSGSFWAETVVNVNSFYGIIPKSQARFELERYLNVTTSQNCGCGGNISPSSVPSNVNIVLDGTTLSCKPPTINLTNLQQQMSSNSIQPISTIPVPSATAV